MLYLLARASGGETWRMATNQPPPRITPERIEEVIVNTDFYVFPGTTLTVCCLTLANGFTVLGESACASPENFNAEIGQRIAKTNAREKIWALEGYALRERLANPAETD